MVGVFKDMNVIPVKGRILHIRQLLIQLLVYLEKKGLIRDDISGLVELGIADWLDGSSFSKSSMLKGSVRLLFNEKVLKEGAKDELMPLAWLYIWLNETYEHVQQCVGAKMAEFLELKEPIKLRHNLSILIRPYLMCGDNSNISKQIGKTSKHKRCPCCSFDWSKKTWSCTGHKSCYDLREIWEMWQTNTNQKMDQYGFLHKSKLFEMIQDWDSSVLENYRIANDPLHITIGHLKNLYHCFKEEKDFDESKCSNAIHEVTKKVIGNKQLFSSADWRIIFLYGEETILKGVTQNIDQAKEIIRTWQTIQKVLCQKHITELDRHIFKAVVLKYYFLLKNRFGDEIEDLYLHLLVFHLSNLLSEFVAPELSTEMEESSFSFDKKIQKNYTSHHKDMVIVELLTRNHFRNKLLDWNIPTNDSGDSLISKKLQLITLQPVYYSTSFIKQHFNEIKDWIQTFGLKSMRFDNSILVGLHSQQENDMEIIYTNDCDISQLNCSQDGNTYTQKNESQQILDFSELNSTQELLDYNCITKDMEITNWKQNDKPLIEAKLKCLICGKGSSPKSCDNGYCKDCCVGGSGTCGYHKRWKNQIEEKEKALKDQNAKNNSKNKKRKVVKQTKSSQKVNKQERQSKKRKRVEQKISPQIKKPSKNTKKCKQSDNEEKGCRCTKGNCTGCICKDHYCTTKCKCGGKCKNLYPCSICNTPSKDIAKCTSCEEYICVKCRTNSSCSKCVEIDAEQFQIRHTYNSGDSCALCDKKEYEICMVNGYCKECCAAHNICQSCSSHSVNINTCHECYHKVCNNCLLYERYCKVCCYD